MKKKQSISYGFFKKPEPDQPAKKPAKKSTKPARKKRAFKPGGWYWIDPRG
jgi:hypothetical protein